MEEEQDLSEEYVQEQVRIIELMLDMCSTDGWKEFLKRVKLSIDEQQNLFTVADAKQLHLAQGRLTILASLTNLRDTLVGELNYLQKDTSVAEFDYNSEFGGELRAGGS